MGTFIKFIIVSAVTGFGTLTAFIGLNRILESTSNSRWVTLTYGCLKMMFAPVLMLPWGDIVTIENGVPKPNPPSYLSLVLVNVIIYMILGALMAAGYLWARWLMYGVMGLIGLYWLFCIGSTLVF